MTPVDCLLPRKLPLGNRLNNQQETNAMPRQYGTGSIYKDGRRDTYVGEVVLDGHRRRVTDRNKKKCSEKLAHLIRQHEQNGVSVDGNATVGQALDLWESRALPARDLAPKSIENYEWVLELLRTELGAKRLQRLDVTDVERALDEIAAGAHGRPAGQRTLTLVRATLRQVLAFAERRKLVVSNAAQYAELPATAAKATPRTALDSEQARKLWEALDGEALGPMFQLQLLTGLRPGEAAGLRWDAIDLDTGTIKVQLAVQLANNNVVLTDNLKTNASRRTIGLSEEAMTLLRDQRQRVLELRIAADEWADLGLVFPTSSGAAWHPRNSRNSLQRICTNAGLPHVRPNELRHTAASILSDRGVPHARIADLLGHTTTRMVDETYRHNLQATADAAVIGGLGEIAAPR